MSQDTVADALNQIMNSLKAGKEEVIVKSPSKFLSSVLAIAKLKGYIESYQLDSNTKTLKIKIGKLNGCNAIKPRIVVKSADIEKFILRYLPAKNIGIIILSTSQGLMTHQTALEKNLGGSLVAYFY